MRRALAQLWEPPMTHLEPRLAELAEALARPGILDALREELRR